MGNSFTDNSSTGDQPAAGARVWHFAGCEFDEAGRSLRAGGQTLDVEAKPIEVLYQLLLHAGEVVTKEELLDSVWPGVTVVEGSLSTAVSKLRKALEKEDPSVILTVPRIGYRLGVPAHWKRVAASPGPELGFRPGQPVPGRDQWLFVRRFDKSGSSEVWLAEHPKTHESRVFKFATDGIRLQGLKREVTLSRVLRESLGERSDFVRVLEWNFQAPPFYLESEYCGENLEGWAEGRGGLAAIPLAERLAVLLQAARAVAAAHAVGILHKDLKPSNVLFGAGADGSRQVKVADFGCGTLAEPARLHELGITNLGFTETLPEPRAVTGTLMYMAPEVLAGQSPTASADVYALGVLLYQLAAGDFRRPLSPGWEAGIADPLIREDIANAACGDPARRLSTAAALVERLETLQQRRVERNQIEQANERARAAERRLMEARARRPWIAAAVVALAAGLAFSVTLYRQALRERDRANRQTAIAAAENQFLANDLLGRTDPFQSGASAETLVDAVRNASPAIDRKFGSEPEVAARLHLAIARALDGRTDYAGARREYETAAALFRKAEGPLAEDAIVAELQRTAMEARNYAEGSLPLARSILAEQEARIARIPHPSGELEVWLASARGMIALIGNDAKVAAQQFRIAYDRASTLPEFDDNTRLKFKQRLAFCSIRLGDGATAERLFRELIDAFTRTAGPDSADVLRVRLNLAQAFMVEGKHEQAVREADSLYPLYVSKLGKDHELSLQLLTTRAQSEGSLEYWDDAIRDDLAIHDLAVRKQGAGSFFAVATLSDAALAQCRSGRYREGEANARRAYEQSRKALGPRAGLTGGVASTLAACEIELGRLTEATKLLDQVDAKVVAQLAADADWPANLDLARAQIAYRGGDFAAARKYLESAGPAFTKPAAEPYQKRAFATLQSKLDRAARH